MQTRSSVIRRRLPRPHFVPKYRPAKIDPSQPPEQQAEELLRAEMEAVIINDNILIPINPTATSDSFDNFDVFSEEELHQAHSLWQEELDKDENTKTALETLADSWLAAFNDIVYLPNTKEFKRYSNLQDPQRLTALRGKFDLLLNQMKREAGKASKLEKKLNVYNGGYMTRANTLHTQIADGHAQLVQTYTEFECFTALRVKEQAGISRRLSKLSNEVDEVSQRENRLQMRYANLMVERDNLQAKVSAVQS